MINLLPDDAKKEVRAARTNVKLVNYLIILGLGVIFLGGISTGVYFILLSNEADAKALVAENTSKSATFSSVRSDADTIRASLSSAKLILDNEVAYTKVMIGIAAVMPKGVVLEKLTLSPATFGTPTTIQAYAKTTAAALALKDSFQQSPLFSNVTLESLATGAQTGEYPITINLGLTINKAAAQ